MPTCVPHVGDAALMAKAEDDWTTQQGKDRDEKVDNNDGEKSGGHQEEEPSDRHVEQDSELNISYKICDMEASCSIFK